MKLSARISAILAAAFAITCFVVAFKGFTSLGGIADPAQLRDAKGFAGFWAFLGSVVLVIAGLSWWSVGSEKE
jgi:hypothetical protein